MYHLLIPDRRTLIAGFAAALAIVGLAPAAASAETFLGSNVDSRVTVAFQVNADAAQSWLPEGWTLAPFGEGPLTGANLLVIFVDRHVNLDPEGKPADSPLYSGVALVSRAIKGDDFRFFVTRVYLTAPDVNPYSNTVAAAVARKATRLAGSDGARGSEDWTITDSDGGTIDFRLSYQGAVPGWSEREALPYSNVEPDFYRIYRYQQISELVHSKPADLDRTDNLAFSSSIAELAPMFDGTEALIAIVAIPWYHRRTYLP